MSNNTKKNDGNKALGVALFGNLFLTTFNISIGYTSGSFALISEGLHTLSDVITSIIAFIGFRVGNRPADDTHPFGHGRAEAISGLIIVVFLCLVAYEIIETAISKLFFNAGISTPTFLAAAMAVVGIITNFLVSREIINIGRSINSPAIVADGYHQRTDIFSSVAILVGVIVSNLGFPIADPIIGLIIGFIILKTAYDVGKDNINNLMGTVPNDSLVNEIKSVADDVDGVISVHDIRVNYFGSYATVTLHASLDHNLSLIEAHKIAHNVQDAITMRVELVESVTCHTCPVGLEYSHSQPIDEEF